MHVLNWTGYTYADEHSTETIDTDWAASCILCISREINSKRVFIGHFFSNFQSKETDPNATPALLRAEPVLIEMLEKQRELFGTQVKIIVRGGSPYFFNDDHPKDLGTCIESAREQRALFLDILEKFTIPSTLLDVRWGELNARCRILYNGTSGQMWEESEQGDIPIEGNENEDHYNDRQTSIIQW